MSRIVEISAIISLTLLIIAGTTVAILGFYHHIIRLINGIRELRTDSEKYKQISKED